MLVTISTPNKKKGNISIMNNKIAVIGAGSAGYAIASELALKGHKVNLYDDKKFESNLIPVKNAGGIEIYGCGIEGFAKMNIVTTVLEEAIENVKFIIICTQAHAHNELAIKLSQCIKDGQFIVLLPGYWGSVIFYNILRFKKSKAIKIAESSTPPYACSRIEGQSKVNIQTIVKPHLAAIPTRETNDVMKEINEIYPNRFFPAKNVLEVAINAVGLFQTAMSILNTSRIESGEDFYHFRQGYTPSVVKVLQAIWKEKGLILEALKLNDLSPFEELQKKLLNPTPEQLSIKRPNSMSHRYITENCPFRLVPMSSLGLTLNIPTPVTNAIIELASIINGIDYYKYGRTMDKLGLSSLKINELIEFFE